MYRKYIDDSKEKHTCPLCERGFDADADFQSFLARLQEKVDLIPQRADAERLAKEKAVKLLGQVYSDVSSVSVYCLCFYFFVCFLSL